MEKINVFIIIYFLSFAVIDFIIYAMLAKYLYMSGGATREDVKLYLSEQGANGQRRLVEWLRHRTPQPAMFETMFRVCSVLSGVAFFSSVLIMVLNIYQNTTVIIVCAVAIAIVSIATALYGFLYSKKVKEAFASYFDGSRYRPYTGEVLSEYIENEFELYEVNEKPTVSFTQAEKEKVDKQVKYGQRIVVLVMFTIILSIPLFTLNQNNSGNDESTTELRQQITGIKNVKKVVGISEDVRCDSSDKIKELFPNYNFLDESIVITDRGLYFGYYDLNSEEEAVNLQKALKVKIVNDFTYEIADEKEENNNNFTIYTFESENVYAVSIYCKNSVIYARSTTNQDEWVKSLLYDLGFLENF